MGDARYNERERVACLRPEALRIVPLGEGQLHGAITSVEWYGAVLSVSVAARRDAQRARCSSPCSAATA